MKSVYERLYRGGAKGGTVYVDGTRDSQVLTLKAEENQYEQTDYFEEKPKTTSGTSRYNSMIFVQQM